MRVNFRSIQKIDLVPEQHKIKRICSEFNSNGNNYELVGLDNLQIPASPVKTLGQFADAIASLPDLRLCCEVIEGENDTSEDTPVNVNFSCDQELVKTNTFYIMPCTVLLQNKVKTLGHFIVNFVIRTATSHSFLDPYYDDNIENIESKIIEVRPLICSLLENNEVFVHEGEPLEFLSLKRLAYLATKIV